MIEGIDVKTPDGEVLGKSKEAAKSAVAQVRGSCLPCTPQVIPSLT